MSERTAKPAHEAPLTVPREPNMGLTTAEHVCLWLPRSPFPFPSIPKTVQVPHGTAADTPSATGQQLRSGYKRLRGQAGSPSLSVAPYQATGSQGAGASPPAEQHQLPQGRHPRPSLPILAIKPTSVPVQGLALIFKA